MYYIQGGISRYSKNLVWSGRTEWAGGMWFITTNNEDVDKVVDGVMYKNTPSIWITNIDHGRRHQPIQLMTKSDNLRFNKKLKNQEDYFHYDNYDAIEVPYTELIPSDYDGIMGVPITFLDKYCPEQFEILGISLYLPLAKPKDLPKDKQGGPAFYLKDENGNYERLYARIVIRKKQ